MKTARRVRRPSVAPALSASASWSMMRVDASRIREKARREYEKAQRDVESARAEVERFEGVDRPAWTRWLHASFGTLLTETRELQVKMMEAQLLVDEVNEELAFGRTRSAATAYRKVMRRREHPAEFDAPPPDPAGSHREEEDFETFERQMHELFEEMFGPDAGPPPAFRDRKRKPVQRRIKELYRELVRRLHPDKSKESSARQMELWHETREAYEAGNADHLESILTLLNEEERGTKESSVSVLARLTASCRKTLRSLKARIMELRREPAWGFSKLKDQKGIFEKTRRMLTAERDQIREHLRYLEEQIAIWKGMAERPAGRSRRSARVRAEASDELF